MSARQTVTTTTTTTRGWKDNNDTKETGKKIASAYSAQLKKARASSKTTGRRVCPTCGRPL